MALRRYQAPEPKRHGKHWTIVVWEDHLQDGQLKRRQRRIRLAPLDTPLRKVLRLRDERLSRVIHADGEELLQHGRREIAQ